MTCTDPVPRGVAAVAGVVVPVEPPLHRHGRGEGPEVRPALAALLEAGAEAGGRGGELRGGEHLLQDVRGVPQPSVGRLDGVRADGVLLILNIIIIYQKCDFVDKEIKTAPVPEQTH